MIYRTVPWGGLALLYRLYPHAYIEWLDEGGPIALPVGMLQYVG